MGEEELAAGTGTMGTILTIFIVAFFAVSVAALLTSVLRGRETALARSLQVTARMSFIIGLILLYLNFVLV